MAEDQDEKDKESISLLGGRDVKNPGAQQNLA